MELIEDWRERLEEGIRRQPVHERVALLERLIVAHESYDEIREAWIAEAERRLDDYKAGLTESVDAEEVLAKLAAMDRDAEENWQPPPVPRDMRDIEEQALHLEHDCFYALLVNVEAELPADVDPHWRSDIRARIHAVPDDIERRYREEGMAAEFNTGSE